MARTSWMRVCDAPASETRAAGGAPAGATDAAGTIIIGAGDCAASEPRASAPRAKNPRKRAGFILATSPAGINLRDPDRFAQSHEFFVDLGLVIGDLDLLSLHFSEKIFELLIGARGGRLGADRAGEKRERAKEH